ncbi:MAG TPA: 50S ribosomal protein L10, partial [Chloroflexi bacterium]|nr:50S ribosomal protein L10 [Chloroflexota bacterium]
MATKNEKATLVDEISALLKNASISIVSGYKDLSVADQQELRARIRETGATFRVVKNSLAIR